MSRFIQLHLLHDSSPGRQKVPRENRRSDHCLRISLKDFLPVEQTARRADDLLNVGIDMLSQARHPISDFGWIGR